ncbi:MAG: signal peptidase I [Gammaproteobacteria bacterium]|nr:signal peptidase I [Gammaproteobacteria bacterium]
MDFNFPLLLVIATALTGGIWLLDAVWWRPARRAEHQRAGHAADADGADGGVEPSAGHQEKEPLVVEYAKSFFPIILAVLVLRSFVVEPFRIPSGSMLPTLLVGDFILVNKYAYGLRLPVVNTRVVDVGSPKRGEVAVFRYPRDPSVDYIKRVVGLPGDRVTYVDKTLYINGERVERVPDGTSDLARCRALVAGRVVETDTLRWRERLGEVEHAILACPDGASLRRDFTVPEGHYFVMGDNRDNSNDSRFWGTVPEENLVGKAFMIWLNVGEWGRIGSWIE